MQNKGNVRQCEDTRFEDLTASIDVDLLMIIYLDIQISNYFCRIEYFENDILIHH